jgi:hypothetical protein
MVSLQIKGLYAVSCPILDPKNHALAALTVPYAERLDQHSRKTVIEIEAAVGRAADVLSSRMGWREADALHPVAGFTKSSTFSEKKRTRARQTASR